MGRFKLGLKEPTYDGRDRQFATYRTPLVAVPADFGDYKRVRHTWGMLANDRYGCCFPAGQAHAVMQETADGAGKAVHVAPSNTLADYFAMNGVEPGPPGSGSDQGTDPRVGLDYHRKVGIVDGAGRRHKLAGYVALEVGNLTELAEAAYLFGAVGIGLNLPQSAQDQFPTGHWRVVPGSPIEGGHWVVCVGRWNGYYEIVTWGERIHVTPQFLSTYMNCGYGMLSAEVIDGQGKSPEGFAYTELQADLGLL